MPQDRVTQRPELGGKLQPSSRTFSLLRDRSHTLRDPPVSPASQVFPFQSFPHNPFPGKSPGAKKEDRSSSAVTFTQQTHKRARGLRVGPGT